jgi:hypothetical protein
METTPSDGVRDMRTLAQRVHRRWLEFRRRNPGMSVPIGDTLSRILEHAPGYQSPRKRAPFRQRQPLRNPGIFTVQEIAATLQTTVGDLLGEPGYASVRDFITPAERRKLRDALTLLSDLFDLEDESLVSSDERDAAAPFVIAPADFIAHDHDYPELLRAWLIPQSPRNIAAAVQSLREVRDSRLRVVRVTGDSMEPALRNGAKVVVDTTRTTPSDGDLVAIYVRGTGGLLGRWMMRDGEPRLEKSNPPGGVIALSPHDEWFVWGIVTMVVEAAEPHPRIVATRDL